MVFRKLNPDQGKNINRSFQLGVIILQGLGLEVKIIINELSFLECDRNSQLSYKIVFKEVNSI